MKKIYNIIGLLFSGLIMSSCSIGKQGVYYTEMGRVPLIEIRENQLLLTTGNSMTNSALLIYKIDYSIDTVLHQIEFKGYQALGKEDKSTHELNLKNFTKEELSTYEYYWVDPDNTKNRMQIKSNEIQLNRKIFELPMTVNEANIIFDIDEYGRSGSIDNRKYLIHEKGDNNVIGITTYLRNYKENSNKSVKIATHPREKYITEFEKEYGVKFKKLDIDNAALINPNFIYTELEDGGILVIGTMYYNLMYNTYTVISYFKGIKKDEFIPYLYQLY